MTFAGQSSENISKKISNFASNRCCQCPLTSYDLAVLSSKRVLTEPTNSLLYPTTGLSLQSDFDSDFSSVSWGHLGRPAFDLAAGVYGNKLFTSDRLSRLSRGRNLNETGHCYKSTGKMCTGSSVL